MDYKELLEKQQDEASTFSKGKIYWVFGSTETEVIDKLEEKGVKPEQVTSIGAGGFILTEYLPDLKKLLDKQAKERREYALKHIYEVVQYYCWDYELYISLSYDLKSLCLELVDLTEEEIQANKEEITRAYKDYCKEFEKLNI